MEQAEDADVCPPLQRLHIATHPTPTTPASMSSSKINNNYQCGSPSAYSDTSSQPSPELSSTSWVSHPSPARAQQQLQQKREEAQHHRRVVSLEIHKYLASLDAEAASTPCVEKLELGAVLGEGAQATVREAQYAGHTVAAKSPRSKMAIAALYREAGVLQHLHRHPLAQKYLTGFVALKEDDKAPLLLLERAQSDLWRLIEEARTEAARDAPVFGEVGWRALALSAASSVAYLHSIGFVHGDIKPENFLVFGSGDERTLKLTDFEAATSTDPTSPFAADKQTGGIAGTHYTTAPELLRMDAGGSTTASDCFALGVTLLCLATGEQPYAGARNGIESVMMAQSGNPVRYAQNQGRLVPRVLEIVQGLCCKKPEERWSAEECLRRLEAM
ncbi:kinase-like domain-containing protein [Protomyces lactucae-debilis]|uniref:Kinase-like domain-containing protein n=1 Tax=Protomyces lactucae-debilis TaxID=2754530 RepID=A0A1Y2EZN7_PROLT|nr:kinase-like domain-containing protein [Protomyces lactucae-debilis]ORY77043.1 kinase-like domain-containing protein [Protomyces lactucae-debilis]